MNTSSLIQKVWNCHTLRDDGVGYGDYLEQLTYLLFLKLAHEYAQEPYKRDTRIPAGYDWASLRGKTGEPLEAHYLAILHKLGTESGMLGAIFFKAQNKIQDPAKLARLVQMIDAELDRAGRRHQGRPLRGPAAEERGRHQERRRPVLHAPGDHPGDGGLRAPSRRRPSPTRPAAQAGSSWRPTNGCRVRAMAEGHAEWLRRTCSS
jgi:hypothetical protein